MASSSRNVKLGVCQVFYDGVDLGLTQGGVEVQVTTETHKTEVDQFGKSAINELVMGRSVSVKCPLAETTVRNMVATMPGAELITNGASATGGVIFTGDPATGNSVTIAGKAFTFQTAKPTGIGQVQVGVNAAASLQNLVDAIALAALRQDIGGIRASINSAGSGVTLTVGDAGTLGNSVTLAATGGTPSGATLAGGVEETKVRVEVGSGVGVDLLQIAKSLRLHPKGKAADDLSDDFLIYKAASPGSLTYAYKLDAERIFNAEFTGFPDPVSGKLYTAGDLTA